jgi:DNA-binding LacI/PurR family transcriptional regulator
MTIEEIRRELLPGDLKQVAQESGLHYNTVGNYLRKCHRPKPETERRILAAFAEIVRQRREMKAQLRNSLTT